MESGAGTVPGLGLLPTAVEFAGEKVLGRPVGEAYGQRVAAYEIHHGRVSVHGGGPFPDGCRPGKVWGTTWHGALENDAFRRLFLADVARTAGRGFVAAPDTDFAAAREARLDALGDLVEQHLDTGAVRRLLAEGAPGGMTVIPPGGPRTRNAPRDPA